MAVYSNEKSMTALRKWIGTGRTFPEGKTFWDENVNVIQEGSQLVLVPKNLYGPGIISSIKRGVKRKRKDGEQEPKSTAEWWTDYPEILKRWFPTLEKITGASRFEMNLTADSKQNTQRF